LTETLGRNTGSALVWRSVQQASVQAIYLLRTLVLARLLVPEHFGLVAIGTTTVGVALNVSNLGMVPALVQRRDAQDTHYDTAWTVGVLRALVITGVMALAAPLFASAFEEPRATNIIRGLALRPLFEALASIRLAGLTRDLRFRTLAAIRIPPAVVDLVLAVALAGTMGVWAMVIGTLGGAATVIVLSYMLAPHKPRFTVDHGAADALIRFGRWIFVKGLLGVAGGALIQLVISRSLGVAALGLYSLAGKLAFLPYQVASEVVGSVAFPLYARLQDDRRAAAEAFRGLLTGMSCLLVPIYCIGIFLAPDLVEHVLGERWEGTVHMIQVLALVGVLGIFGDAANPLIQGLGHPRKTVVVGALQTALIIAFAQPLAAQFGAVGAAGAWIPAIASSQILSGYYVRELVPTPFSGLARPLLAMIVASAAAGVVAFVLVGAIGNALGPILAGVLALLTAGGILWDLDRRFRLGFGASIHHLFPRLARLSR
jgi:O-antigen/teichoic acid export membrane protein